MNRSARPRLRALATAALVAGTALGGVVVASPAATAAVPHPDLLVVDRSGERLLEIPSGSDQPVEVASDLGVASYVTSDRRGRPWVTTWPQLFRAPSGPGPHSGLGGFGAAFDTAFSGGRAFVSDQGTLVSMALDGTDRRRFATGATSITGLATTPEGDILAAAPSDGKILRITPQGDVSEFVGGVPNVFDVARDPDGSYVIGTSGATMRVPASGGSAEPITNQVPNNLGVTVDADGTIYATDAGNGDLYAIPDGSTTPQLVAGGLGFPLGVEVAQPLLPPVSQEIVLTSTAPTTALVDGASYTPTATGGGSGQPVTFSTSTPSVCTYSSTMNAVSFVGAGSCTVAADQAGGTDREFTDYAAAPRKTQTFTVGKGAQAITFAEDTPTTGTVGQSFTPEATGGASGNPVTFTVTGGCSLQDSTVTFTRRGTCTVEASQAGNQDYDAAPTEQAPITVQPRTGAQEITYTSTAPTTAVVDGASYTPAATGGGSGQPVTFSTTTPSTCTYSSTTGPVSVVGAGDCTVAADQAGGTAGGITYAPAATKTQTFAVGKGAQTITFAADTPTTGEVGDSFSPSATGGASGNSVTFTASGACGQPGSDNASTVFFLRRGTCLVTAEQAGNDDYEAAPNTQASVAVEVAPTTVDLEVTDEGMTATVTGPDSGPAPTGDVTFNLDQGPTRQPLGAVTLTPVDGEPTLATATLPASADPGTGGRIIASYPGLEDENGFLLGGSEDTYDRTAPTITAAVTSREPANEAGWYRTRATVDFTCTAGSAELVTDCPVRISRANSRPDFAAIGLVTAADGGTGTATVPLQVDTRGPVLDVRRVGRAPYSRTARPVRCTAVDGRSGVDGSCTVTYGRVVAGPNGGARRTWTATATDVAGNTTTRSNGFTVTGAAPRPTRSPGR